MQRQEEVEYGVCPECGQPTLPVLALLPCGHAREPELRKLQTPGTVYSWTRSRIGQEDVVMVMVDFLDGELRVTAPLYADDDPQINMRVHIVPGRNTPYAFEAVS